MKPLEELTDEELATLNQRYEDRCTLFLQDLQAFLHMHAQHLHAIGYNSLEDCTESLKSRARKVLGPIPKPPHGFYATNLLRNPKP